MIDLYILLLFIYLIIFTLSFKASRFWGRSYPETIFRAIISPAIALYCIVNIIVWRTKRWFKRK